MTCSAIISLRNTHRADKTFHRVVSGTQTECAGSFFFNVNLHDDRVGFHTRIHFDVDIFKESEIVNPLHGTTRQLCVERLTGFLSHFTGDDVILRLFVALDGVAFQSTFVDFQSEYAVVVNVHIGNFHQDVTVAAIFFLNRCHVVVQRVAVQNFAGSQSYKLVNFALFVNGVAGNLNVLQNRIFHHVIGYHHAFRNFPESRVSVIKISGRIDGVSVPQRGIGIKFVADVGENGSFNRRQSHIACTFVKNFDNRFPVELLHILAHFFFGLSVAFRLGRRLVTLNLQLPGIFAAGTGLISGAFVLTD